MNRTALVVLASFVLAGAAHAAKGDAQAGKGKAAACVACHGESGVSAAPEFPKIAGQHADYLATALRHYKAGKRKNPIMAGQVANLSEKDMLDLAAYYASQPGLAIRY
ncbi:MAG: cytochrome c [Burkholderiales bacterium]